MQRRSHTVRAALAVTLNRSVGRPVLVRPRDGIASCVGIGSGVVCAAISRGVGIRGLIQHGCASGAGASCA